MFKVNYDLPELSSNAQAFEYWKIRLNKDIEYRMSMKDELVDKFDYALPFIDAIDYCPDREDFEKMLPIIDKWIFNCKTKIIKTDCCCLDDMLFDVQGYILEAGVFEFGIDDISCNSIAMFILNKEADGSIKVYKKQMSFNKEIYHNVKFMDVIADTANHMSFIHYAIANAHSICDAAFKHDIDTLVRLLSNKPNANLSNLENCSMNSIKPINVRFKCLDLLDGINNVFEWHNNNSIIMKKDGIDKVLLINLR